MALIEQRYRVAARRSTPAADILDQAWIPVVEQLRAGPLAGLPVVPGGRSSGARVACRTARAVGAAGVLCLAFLLIAPSGTSRERARRRDRARPRGPGRARPLTRAGAGGLREVAGIRGHGLNSDREGLRTAVRGWLAARQFFQSAASIP